ncbi:hypothetical protein [Rhodococcus sp. IEGM 1408]|uniref:hypothetical protein n=1 Tax=Rhodococcus sp. IEGM 1408 TaxID=3082220 RepID=UPI002954C28B|nr:hypothetical protein [Rhodococcus sp. IEGM 1408]MDV8003004.1 hypothetical protein [Rhodococcus sp. IEGM 1408]
MSSVHDKLIADVQNLARQCDTTERQIAGLKTQLGSSVRQLQALLGTGGGGAIGQMMTSLSQAQNEIDRMAENVRRTKQSAENYAGHLRSLR